MYISFPSHAGSDTDTPQTYDGGFAGSSSEEPHGTPPTPNPPTP